MPSVDVSWKGHCRDPQIRYRLLSHLHLLASLSDRYLRRREGPGVLSIVDENYEPPRRANIEMIDEALSGEIRVSASIGAHPEILVARAREAGLKVIVPEGEGPHLIVLDKVRLRGLDFKLFDPKPLHPGADRMSFVFLECPDYHFLDGRIAEIAGPEGARGAEALRAGDISLHTPSIHLRAYLEEWSDCLFSWVRFFLMGDFWWQARQELQGYSDYRGVFEQLQTERGSAVAEEATFDAVLSTFSQHAEHRIGEAQDVSKREGGAG